MEMTDEDIELKYKNIIDEALKNVKQELIILIDDIPYLIYIHEIYIKEDGKHEIDWSTPHDNTEIDRDILFSHVVDAINAQFKEFNECQSKKPFSRIYLLMKNIFDKFFRS